MLCLNRFLFFPRGSDKYFSIPMGIVTLSYLYRCAIYRLGIYTQAVCCSFHKAEPLSGQSNRKCKKKKMVFSVSGRTQQSFVIEKYIQEHISRQVWLKFTESCRPLIAKLYVKRPLFTFYRIKCTYIRSVVSSLSEHLMKYEIDSESSRVTRERTTMDWPSVRKMTYYNIIMCNCASALCTFKHRKRKYLIDV